jgi:CO/xanthine dehydrogenase Mo-binding subunit
MAPRTTPEVGGMGHSVKRKEDPRFIRGQGRYVDDIQLPGMLYLDIVRSPFAHARIKSINTERALKVPGVLAVISTAEESELHRIAKELLIDPPDLLALRLAHQRHLPGMRRE